MLQGVGEGLGRPLTIKPLSVMSSSTPSLFNDRQAGGHCLQHGVAHSFMCAGHEEDVAFAVQGGQAFCRNGAMEVYTA